MSYKLKFLPTALKEWKKLDNSILAQFRKKLKERLEVPHVPLRLQKPKFLQVALKILGSSQEQNYPPSKVNTFNYGYIQSTSGILFVVNSLITSIDKNSEKSSQLSRLLIWLNVILVIATLALAIIAGTDLYLRIQGVDSFHQSTQISTDVSK